jgi:hypothetical protein
MTGIHASSCQELQWQATPERKGQGQRWGHWSALPVHSTLQASPPNLLRHFACSSALTDCLLCSHARVVFTRGAVAESQADKC